MWPLFDKRAERYLTAVTGVQSIAERLFAQNFVPGKGRSLRDDTLAADPTYEECGRLALDGLPCRIIGKGRGMARHREANDRHLPD
jgi:hypothetical protein